MAAACTSDGPDANSGTSAGGTSGPVQVELWHGQVDTAKKAMDAAVEEFNASQDDVEVVVSSGGVSPDQMLPKVTTAIASGTYPDIAYMYGSWGGNLATSPAIADLTSFVAQPEVNWEDFWPAARNTATVDGKVIGFPAIIDNLSVVYNKKVFDDAI